MNGHPDRARPVYFADGPARRDRARTLKFLAALVGVAMVLTALGGVATSIALGYGLQPVPVGMAAAPGGGGEAVEAAPADSTVEALRAEVSKLDAALAARAPRRVYIVIDRYNNRLWLRRGSEVKLEAVVSTGSGTILKESGGAQRTWTFDTPPGRFVVLSERRNPVWTKPDWAFLEEGQQPPKTLRERREEGSLGEWALDLGDGYMIHGTLYERLLGRNITHGCVRVGRDDLRVVASTANPGTPVYIY
jgi:L,D-transpeptidase YbiS